MTSNSIIHQKLDEIFSDGEAQAQFFQQLLPLCLKVLVADKIQKGELTAQEEKEWRSRPPAAKLLEPYNVSYQQYRALLQGKGTTTSYLNFKRAIERNGYDFERLFYSEDLINLAYNYLLEKKKATKHLKL